MNSASRLSRRTLGLAAISLVLAPRPTVGQQLAHERDTQESIVDIRCTFGNRSFTVTLFDSAAARELVAMLPLDLSIDDYANNEKIAYLPRKLTHHGSEPFTGEAPGDVCYYAPWGNLAFFYGSYRYSNGLLRLGRLKDGPEPLLRRGKFPLKIEVDR